MVQQQARIRSRKNVVRRTALSTAAVLAAGTAVFVAANSATAEQSGNSTAASTHVDVYWKTEGPGNDLTGIDQVMRVERKAPYQYWSMYFNYAGARDGGYMGLQTHARRSDGSYGESAIFSLWNADKSRDRDGTCVTFTGEGDGLSCRMTFTVKLATDYRYRVKRLESDATGQWWGAWIRDMSTGRDTYLGDLHSTSRYLAAPVINFSEYWGDPVPCAQVPRSRVLWTQPAANLPEPYEARAMVYRYHSRYDTTVIADCTKATVRPVNLGWTTGVRVTAGTGGS